MKKTIIMSLASALAISGGQAALVDGLVNYWPLDGNLSDAAHGVTGSASAVADNGSFDGANGTGGISYDAGLFGQATLQDGATDAAQNNGFVSITQSADTNFGGESMTISLWTQVASFDTNWQALIVAGEGTNYRIARRDFDSTVAYSGGIEEGSNDLPTDITSGWNHILATTANGGATNLYVNGVLVSTNAGPATITDDAPSVPLGIGANTDTGNAQNREWNGHIDDVAQWNRVLDTSEIAALYGGGPSSAQSLGTLITIPEPSSLALVALSGLGLFRRRR